VHAERQLPDCEFADKIILGIYGTRRFVPNCAYIVLLAVITTTYRGYTVDFSVTVDSCLASMPKEAHEFP
jgi:hypothetical protein